MQRIGLSRLEPLMVVIGSLGFWYDGERLEVRCIAPGNPARPTKSQEEILVYNRERQKRLRQNRTAF